MTENFLSKDENGKWNTNPPVPSELLRNVNCHKFLLYVLGKISWDEMVSDPKEQTRKQPDFDFTYGDKALAISNKGFELIQSADELVQFADETCDRNAMYVGQIRDSKSGEMAHSFIVKRMPNGSYECYDKQGFKDYEFSAYDLLSLPDFINDKGEKSYQNQLWRFISVPEIS